MHFITSVLTMGSIATLASATVGFEYPANVPMSKRQTSGYAIQNAATSGYCSDPKWLSLLDGCLDCALTYNIWQYYGTQVGAAAKACGLDATPKPSTAAGSGSSSAASTTGAPTSTSAAAISTSTLATQQSTSSQVPSGSSTAAQATSQSSQTQTSGGATTSSAASHSTGATNGTATSTVPKGAAAGFQQPAILAVGAIAAFAVNMI
ncbi:hypothetical protein NQ176_g9164 [Zarea fungicola]|uniref:Uncharacterized protein n=1 Tax=Zarea fungicola TaxID=93591 RepID=A0ACC1MN80_9HYPO|nr:hypothetical protein NQ176_g9164 [Lecanicillium fungicola]